jgi:hypothetical protein
MKNCTEESFIISDKIVNKIEDFFNEKVSIGKRQQIKSSISPEISNVMFNRENDIIEEERLRVIYSISNCLEYVDFKNCIINLKYKISLK